MLTGLRVTGIGLAGLGLGVALWLLASDGGDRHGVASRGAGGDAPRTRPTGPALAGRVSDPVAQAPSPAGHAPLDPAAAGGLRLRLHRVDGRPAPSVEVELAPEAGPAARALTDADGTALFEGLAAGRVRWTVAAPWVRVSWGESTQVKAQRTSEETVILARAGTVEGRVLDRATSAPVARALVRVEHGGYVEGVEESGGRSHFDVRETGDDGAYRFELVPLDAVVTLAAWSAAHARTALSDLLGRDGAGLVRRDLLLERAATLRVQVVTAEGRPAAGALVEAWPDSERPRGEVLRGAQQPVELDVIGSVWAGAAPFRAECDAEGIALVPGLPYLAPLTVVAWHRPAESAQSAGPVVLRAGEPAPEVRLVLVRPATLILQVLGAEVLEAQGQERPFVELTGDRSGFAKEPGTDLFTCTTQPGRREVRVRCKGCAETRLIVDLEPGETRLQAVRLKEARCFSGTVEEADGSPLRAPLRRVGRPRAEEEATADATTSSGLEGGGFTWCPQEPAPCLRLEVEDDWGRVASAAVDPAGASGLLLRMPAAAQIEFQLATAEPVSARQLLVVLVPEVRPDDPWQPDLHLGEVTRRPGGQGSLRSVTLTASGGRSVLRVMAERFAPLQLVVAPAPGERLNLGALALERGRSVCVRARDGQGRDLALAWATLDLGHGLTRRQAVDEHQPTFDHAPSGALRVRVECVGFVPAEAEVPEAGAGPEEVSVTLDRGVLLRGQVRVPEGGAALGSGRRVEILRAPPGQRPALLRSAPVSYGGAFAERVGPGSYRLRVRDGERVLAEGDVEATDGPEQTVELTQQGLAPSGPGSSR